MKIKNQVIDLSRSRVFFDFDNTITTFDTLDDIIEKFSVNKDWVALEKAWEKGKIGSKECLEGQLRLVRMTKTGLLGYLKGVKLDPYFKRLLALLRRKGVKPVILSDNFSFIINHILGLNRVKGLKVHANHLKFNQDRLVPFFPHRHLTCGSCAHCKKNNLLKHPVRNKIAIYIGDGHSDICPAQVSDIVFAKASLLKHFKLIKKPCVPIKNLHDVYIYLRG